MKVEVIGRKWNSAIPPYKSNPLWKPFEPVLVKIETTVFLPLSLKMLLHNILYKAK
jgi:hypothetical protein